MKGSRNGFAVVVTTLVSALLWGGCASQGETSDGMPQGDVSSIGVLTAEVQDLVDQGNLAVREGRYADGLSLFRQAMEGQPGHAVPQFGALMAAMALNETALVDSLRKELEFTGPELLSMLGPGGAMGGGTTPNPHTAPLGLPASATQTQPTRGPVRRSRYTKGPVSDSPAPRVPPRGSRLK